MKMNENIRKRGHTMRYIGGKTLLLDYIIDTIEAETENIKTVIDIFSGSGTVGNALKAKTI